MPKSWTAEEIIAAARNLSMTPDTGASGSDTPDLLAHLNEYLLGELVPEVLAVRQDYFVRTKRYTISSSMPRLRIDHRALLQKIQRCVLYDSSGNIVPGFTELTRAKMPSRALNPTGPQTPQGWEIEGNDIILWPPPVGFSGTLEVSFPFRPGEMVLSTKARQITSLSYDGEYTAVGFGSSITGSNLFQGMTCDIHSKSSGAEIKAWSRSVRLPAGGGGGTISSLEVIGKLDGTDTGERAVEVGDWFCAEGEAALPGIPVEMHPMLAKGVAVALAVAMKDGEAAQYHSSVLKAGVKTQLENMEPRATHSKPRLGGARFLSMQRRRY